MFPPKRREKEKGDDPCNSFIGQMVVALKVKGKGEEREEKGEGGGKKKSSQDTLLERHMSDPAAP